MTVSKRRAQTPGIADRLSTDYPIVVTQNSA
jgi:hypothetical protein